MRSLITTLVFLLAGWIHVAAHAQGTAPAAAAGQTIRDCSDCPDLVVVPAGDFVMGSNASEHERFGVAPVYTTTELPAHPVRIARPFAIARTLVTRDDWARYVAATKEVPSGCSVFRPEGVWAVDPAASWRAPGFEQGGREPVVCVNLEDAQGYAAWLSARTGQTYRLPSEAEWEYAARAGTATANYWGDRKDDACRDTNVADQSRIAGMPNRAALVDYVLPCDDGYAFTAPVDAFPPNAFGLYGMSGNVNQIVQDCFHETYDGAPSDGRPWSGGDCRYHMDRGASWVNSPRFMRAAMRHKDLIDARLSVVGFRLVRELSR